MMKGESMILMPQHFFSGCTHVFMRKYGGLRPIAFQLQSSDSMASCGYSFLNSSSGSSSTNMEETDCRASCDAGRHGGCGLVRLQDTDGARWTGRTWGKICPIPMLITRSTGRGALFNWSAVSRATRHGICIEVAVTVLVNTVHSKGSSSRAQQARRPVMLRAAVRLRERDCGTERETERETERLWD